MTLQGNSQNTLTKQNRVKTTIDSNGDTLITMKYEDARILLRDVLYYEYVEELLMEYKHKDTVNQEIITIQKSTIDKVTQRNNILDTLLLILEEVIRNKDTELGYKDDIIKQQKKEIFKQKVFKFIGYTGTIDLPIITMIILL